MDTITHGIAGALIGKALFQGDDLFASRPMNLQRIVTWSTMLGSIFPDADTFRDILSRNELLVITWHRSITHSLLCLPVFALLLAALTRSIARRRKWNAPSFAILTGIYAVGILSHILLDLATSFGTMVWAPLKWSRPAWDLIFIVDFTFTGILLVPQIVAWVHARPERSKRRALVSLALFMIAGFVVQKITDNVGTAISAQSVFLFLAILAALFLLPLRGQQTSRNPRQWHLHRQDPRGFWSRTGLVFACGYLVIAIFAHRAALYRVKSFSAMQKLDVESMGVLPFPPSLWRWDGLVRTPRGVYELRMDLSDKSAFAVAAAMNPAERPPLEYRFYPEAFPNTYIEAAKEIPEVQQVLWFARFPVTHFHQEGGEAIVEFSDMRFPQMRRGRAAPFTYRVRFGPGGDIRELGWAK
jgi:membrane-bound metal-dependent hydrolase YbcI (DUF457 family)